MALEDSGLNMESEDPSRLGIVLGNGCKEVPRTSKTEVRLSIDPGRDAAEPLLHPMILPNMATSQVSRVLGLKGFTPAVTTACVTGTLGGG